jgi:predicted aspartyl protease
MIVFHYVSNLSPPAPFVSVDLSSTDGQAVVTGVLAQLDSAADLTVVPLPLVERLGASEIEERSFGGFDGSVAKLSVYRVLLTIHGTTSPYLVDVVASPIEPWILLGRDVLNQFRVVLDGPSQKVENG